MILALALGMLPMPVIAQTHIFTLEDAPAASRPRPADIYDDPRIIHTEGVAVDAVGATHSTASPPAQIPPSSEITGQNTLPEGSDAVNSEAASEGAATDANSQEESSANQQPAARKDRTQSARDRIYEKIRSNRSR